MGDGEGTEPSRPPEPLHDESVRAALEQPVVQALLSLNDERIRAALSLPAAQSVLCTAAAAEEAKAQRVLSLLRAKDEAIAALDTELGAVHAALSDAQATVARQRELAAPLAQQMDEIVAERRRAAAQLEQERQRAQAAEERLAASAQDARDKGDATDAAAAATARASEAEAAAAAALAQLIEAERAAEVSDAARARAEAAQRELAARLDEAELAASTLRSERLARLEAESKLRDAEARIYGMVESSVGIVYTGLEPECTSSAPTSVSQQLCSPADAMVPPVGTTPWAEGCGREDLHLVLDELAELQAQHGALREALEAADADIQAVIERSRLSRESAEFEVSSERQRLTQCKAELETCQVLLGEARSALAATQEQLQIEAESRARLEERLTQAERLLDTGRAEAAAQRTQHEQRLREAAEVAEEVRKAAEEAHIRQMDEMQETMRRLSARLSSSIKPSNHEGEANGRKRGSLRSAPLEHHRLHPACGSGASPSAKYRQLHDADGHVASVLSIGLIETDGEVVERTPARSHGEFEVCAVHDCSRDAETENQWEGAMEELVVEVASLRQRLVAAEVASARRARESADELARAQRWAEEAEARWKLHRRDEESTIASLKQQLHLLSSSSTGDRSELAAAISRAAEATREEAWAKRQLEHERTLSAAAAERETELRTRLALAEEKAAFVTAIAAGPATGAVPNGNCVGGPHDSDGNYPAGTATDPARCTSVSLDVSGSRSSRWACEQIVLRLQRKVSQLTSGVQAAQALEPRQLVPGGMQGTGETCLGGQASRQSGSRPLGVDDNSSLGAGGAPACALEDDAVAPLGNAEDEVVRLRSLLARAGLEVKALRARLTAIQAEAGVNVEASAESCSDSGAGNAPTRLRAAADEAAHLASQLLDARETAAREAMAREAEHIRQLAEARAEAYRARSALDGLANERATLAAREAQACSVLRRVQAEAAAAAAAAVTDREADREEVSSARARAEAAEAEAAQAAATAKEATVRAKVLQETLDALQESEAVFVPSRTIDVDRARQGSAAAAAGAAQVETHVSAAAAAVAAAEAAIEDNRGDSTSAPELVSLRRAVGSLSSQLLTVGSHAMKLERRQEESRTTIERYAAQMQRYAAESREAKRVAAELRAEVASLHASSELASAETQGMRRQMEELQFELRHYDSRAEQAERRASALEAAHESVRAQLEQAHTRHLAALQSERESAARAARELGEALVTATLASEDAAANGVSTKPGLTLLLAGSDVGAFTGANNKHEPPSLEDGALCDDAKCIDRAARGGDGGADGCNASALADLRSSLDISPMRIVRNELRAAIAAIKANFCHAEGATAALGGGGAWPSYICGTSATAADPGSAPQSASAQAAIGSRNGHRMAQEPSECSLGSGGGGSQLEALSALLLQHNALLGREMARGVCLTAEVRGLRRRLQDASGALIRHETERHIACAQLLLLKRQEEERYALRSGARARTNAASGARESALAAALDESNAAAIELERRLHAATTELAELRQTFGRAQGVTALQAHDALKDGFAGRSDASPAPVSGPLTSSVEASLLRAQLEEASAARSSEVEERMLEAARRAAADASGTGAARKLAAELEASRLANSRLTDLASAATRRGDAARAQLCACQESLRVAERENIRLRAAVTAAVRHEFAVEEVRQGAGRSLQEGEAKSNTVGEGIGSLRARLAAAEAAMAAARSKQAAAEERASLADAALAHSRQRRDAVIRWSTTLETAAVRSANEGMRAVMANAQESELALRQALDEERRAHARTLALATALQQWQRRKHKRPVAANGGDAGQGGGEAGLDDDLRRENSRLHATCAATTLQLEEALEKLEQRDHALKSLQATLVAVTAGSPGSEQYAGGAVAGGSVDRRPVTRTKPSSRFPDRGRSGSAPCGGGVRSATTDVTTSAPPSRKATRTDLLAYQLVRARLSEEEARSQLRASAQREVQLHEQLGVLQRRLNMRAAPRDGEVSMVGEAHGMTEPGSESGTSLAQLRASLARSRAEVAGLQAQIARELAGTNFLRLEPTSSANSTLDGVAGVLNEVDDEVARVLERLLGDATVSESAMSPRGVAQHRATAQHDISPSQTGPGAAKRRQDEQQVAAALSALRRSGILEGHAEEDAAMLVQAVRLLSSRITALEAMQPTAPQRSEAIVKIGLQRRARSDRSPTRLVSTTTDAEGDAIHMTHAGAASCGELMEAQLLSERLTSASLREELRSEREIREIETAELRERLAVLVEAQRLSRLRYRQQAEALTQREAEAREAREELVARQLAAGSAEEEVLRNQLAAAEATAEREAAERAVAERRLRDLESELSAWRSAVAMDEASRVGPAAIMTADELMHAEAAGKDGPAGLAALHSSLRRRDQLEVEVRSLRDALDAERRAKVSLVSSNEAATRRLAELRDELVRMGEAVSAAEAGRDAARDVATAELAMSEQALAASEQAREVVESDLISLRGEVASLRREADAAKQEARRVTRESRDRMESLRKEADERACEATAVKADLDELRHRLGEALSEADESRCRLGEVLSEVDESRRRLSEALSEAEELRHALEEAKEDAAAAVAAATTAYAEERERHEQQIVELRQEHERQQAKTTAEHVDMRSHMETQLHEQLEALRLSVRQWQQQQPNAAAPAESVATQAEAEAAEAEAGRRREHDEVAAEMTEIADEVGALRQALHSLGGKEYQSRLSSSMTLPAPPPLQAARACAKASAIHLSPSGSQAAGKAHNPPPELTDVRALRLEAQVLILRREADSERAAALQLASEVDRLKEAHATLSAQLASQHALAQEAGRASRREVRALQAQLQKASDRLAVGAKAEAQLGAAAEATRAKARALRLTEEVLADTRRQLSAERSAKQELERQLAEAREAADAADQRAAKARADLRAREPLLRESRAKLAAAKSSESAWLDERIRLLERAARAETDAKAKERLLTDARRRVAEAEKAGEAAVVAAECRCREHTETSMRLWRQDSEVVASSLREKLEATEQVLSQVRREHAEAIADASDRDAECRRLAAESEQRRAALGAMRQLIHDLVQRLLAVRLPGSPTMQRSPQGVPHRWIAGRCGVSAHKEDQVDEEELDEARRIEQLSSSLLQLPACELGFFTPVGRRRGGAHGGEPGTPPSCSTEDAMSAARTTAANSAASPQDAAAGRPSAPQADNSGGGSAEPAQELRLLLEADGPVDVPQCLTLLWRLVRLYSQRRFEHERRDGVPTTKPEGVAGMPAKQGEDVEAVQQTLGSYDLMLRAIRRQVEAEQTEAAIAIAERDEEIDRLRIQAEELQQQLASAWKGSGVDAHKDAGPCTLPDSTPVESADSAWAHAAGHSLGAGAAAFAAVLKRRAPRTPPRSSAVTASRASGLDERSTGGFFSVPASPEK